MSLEEVAVITEEERATIEFLRAASELGIRVTNVLEFQKKNKRSRVRIPLGVENKTEQALMYINRLEGDHPTVVMVLQVIIANPDQLCGISQVF